MSGTPHSTSQGPGREAGPRTPDRISDLIAGNDVMLFMKGDRAAPQCGFSATVVRILDGLIPAYQTFDVLSDQAIREGIKEFSSWPTIPQLYVKGEFIGGCDIIQELYASGELQQKLGVEVGDVAPPAIALSDEAARGLADAVAGAAPGQGLHLTVDARYQATLALAPAAPGAMQVDVKGVSFLVDPMSAKRADGISIDVVDTPQGRGFRIDNPNADPAGGGVRPMPVAELERRLAAGERFEFLDVRTPEERATASLPGTRLLTPDESRRLEGLPRDTMLVFHCHHGGRSQAAAEQFAAQGFSNVWNVEGGIDAWSREIDPSVPRY